MARILRQVTVVRDGNHNAFTDLQFWQSCYWVTYRKGSGHVSMDGAVALSVSADGGDWWTQTHSDPAKTLKAE